MTSSPRRRRMPPLAWLAGLAALLIACSCSSGASPAGDSSSGPSVDASAATSPSAVLSITDAKGRTVDVPADPQRVVALSEPTLDGALALDVPVVGATSGRGQSGVSAYLSERANGIPIVASVSGPEFEKVKLLNPDLILIDGTVSSDDAVLGKLDQIAPTVYVSVTGEDWQKAFAAEAEALNRSAAASAVFAQYRSRVAEVHAALGDNAGATVSIVRWGSGMPSVLLKELAASRVVADVGLSRPPAQDKEGPGHSQPISLENLDQLDADWMFFGTLAGGTGPAAGNDASPSEVGIQASEKALESAEETPGFTALTAYRDHHIVPVDGSAWTSAGGPIAAEQVLDAIAAAMAPGSGPGGGK